MMMGLCQESVIGVVAVELLEVSNIAISGLVLDDGMR
jgi:hypothetical protein